MYANAGTSSDTSVPSNMHELEPVPKMQVTAGSPVYVL